mgnify:FL=1
MQRIFTLLLLIFPVFSTLAQETDVLTQENVEAAVQMGDGVSFESIGRGLLGMVFLIGICYLLSSNKKKINWRLVIIGLVLQLVFAILIFKVDFVALAFDWISEPHNGHCTN